MTYKLTDKWIQACAEGEPEDLYHMGVQAMARRLLAAERVLKQLDDTVISPDTQSSIWWALMAYDREVRDE